MKSRTTGGYSSDSEQPSNSKQKKDDLSILRKPINTSLNGFLEAKRAYENGTDEIRRLLSRECDVIYECKECRNIFRSLTNFISHKRVYCRNLHSGFNGNGFIDISTIIQAEQEFANKKTGSTTQSVATNTLSTGAITAKENKDLSSIIDRLIQREHENSIMDLTDFYDQVDKKLTKEQVLKRKHTLQLDRVPHSNVAVYQTLKSNYKHQGRDNMRNEVEEVHEMMANNKNVLGPDGKILSSNCSSSKPKDRKDLPFDLREWDDEEDEDDDDDDISCNICHSKFTTEKSLKLHIQTKHISSNLVYPCPSCQLTFLQPAAVYRHLSNFHNKTQRQIRQLRDTIQKRVHRADEVHFKAQNRELARLKTSNDLKQKSESRDWVEVVGKEITSTPTCPFCSRKFDRKAVLRTHMVSCPAQKKPSATISIDSNSNSNSSAAISPVVFENGDSKDSQGSTSSSSRRKKSRMPMKIINATCVMEDDSKKKVLDLKDTIALNELFKNLGKEELSLKTVNLDNLTLPQSVEIKKEVLDEPKPLEVTEQVETPVKEPTPPPPPPVVVAPPPPPPPAVASKTSSATPGVPVQTVIIPITKPPARIQKCYCKICKKKFDAVSNLKRHIAMYHYRKRKFGCKHCNFKGYRKYDVTNHLIAMHSMAHGTDLSEHMQTIEETFTREVTDDIVFMDDDEQIEEKVVYKSYSKKDKEKEKEKDKEKEKEKKEEKAVEPKKIKEEKEIVVKEEPSSEPPEVSISIPVITSTPKITRLSTSLSERKDSPERSIKIEKEDPKEMVPPTLTKRPIRNRVKPVNKDFVYDMSGLIKNDSGYGSEKEVTPIRTSRRRNTVSLSNDIPPPFNYQASPSPTKKAVPPPPPILPIFDYEIKNKDEIRGITQKLALGLVAKNLAAYGSMPEIPEEKPFCLAGMIAPPPPRIEQSSSSDEDAIVKRLGVKKRRLDLFQRESSQSSTTALIPIFKHSEENMASPPSPAIIPEEKTPPPTPTKRISLLQRYNESKAKKLQESLLRSALEN
ncbi:ZNF800 family protein [Megaselia abdita]